MTLTNEEILEKLIIKSCQMAIAINTDNHRKEMRLSIEIGALKQEILNRMEV